VLVGKAARLARMAEVMEHLARTAEVMERSLVLRTGSERESSLDQRLARGAGGSRRRCVSWSRRSSISLSR
jgi:hypothetical protein